jgi:hypothetical protein
MADPGAPKSVLFAGKLIEKKRPLDLIQALALASFAKPGTFLLVHAGRDIATLNWRFFCSLTM